MTHKPCIHAYVNRSFIISEQNKIKILVIRLICKAAKAADEQYTVTILPFWLHPYMRRIADLVLTAVSAFISRDVKGYHIAALKMCAESDRTFRRYYYRVRNRIVSWNTCLAMQLTSLNIKINQSREPINTSKSVLQRWVIFNDYSSTYCTRLNELKNSQFPLFGEWRLRYILYLLNLNVAGLGP